MAGCEISSVYAGIAGGHITGFNSRGIVAIKGPEITQQDVERVIDAARAVAIPMDREVIHVLPQEFIVEAAATFRLVVCGDVLAVRRPDGASQPAVDGRESHRVGARGRGDPQITVIARALRIL